MPSPSALKAEGGLEIVVIPVASHVPTAVLDVRQRKVACPTSVPTDTLTISIYSTCACLEATAEIVSIPPASRTAIRLSYTGDNIKDKATKTLFIDSNDGAHPRLTFTVTGRVTPEELPHLSAVPDPLLFDPSDPSYPAVFVGITNRGENDLEIRAVRCFGCVNDWTQKALGKGEEAKLRLEALPDWPQERWVEIESNDPVFPVKRIGIIEADTTPDAQGDR